MTIQSNDARARKAVSGECRSYAVVALLMGTALVTGLLLRGFDRPAAAQPTSDVGGKLGYLSKAKAARSDGDDELAQFYYLAALNAFPGDSEIALEYADFVDAVATNLEGRQPADAAGRLRDAAAVLRGQALLVAPERVKPLVERAREMETRANELLEQLPRSGSAAEDQDVQAALAELQRIVAADVPPKPADRRERLRRIQELQTLVAANASIDPETQAKVDRHVSTLQALVTLDTLEQRCHDYLNKAQAEENPTAALMLLQVAESLVREMVSTLASGPALPEARRDEYAAAVTFMMDQLQWISREKSAAEQRQIDEEIWKRFVNSIERDLSEIDRWKPPEDANPDGAFTKQIQKVSELTRRVVGAAARLRDEQVVETARELMTRLNTQAADLMKQRQRRYDLWAMDQMNAAWGKYLEAKGVTDDDEKKMKKALVQHFGPVDARLLSYEIAQIYQQAMNEILSELDAGSPGDVDEATKIGALRKMFETEKLTFEDF